MTSNAVRPSEKAAAAANAPALGTLRLLQAMGLSAVMITPDVVALKAKIVKA